MSRCTASLGDSLGCENPPKGGNTYEITIKEGDRLIVKVESGFTKELIKTIIAPRGISIEQTTDGLMYHKVDWSIRANTPYSSEF